jgi:hypothetical protein
MAGQPSRQSCAEPVSFRAPRERVCPRIIAVDASFGISAAPSSTQPGGSAPDDDAFSIGCPDQLVDLPFAASIRFATFYLPHIYLERIAAHDHIVDVYHVMYLKIPAVFIEFLSDALRVYTPS